MKMKKYFWLLFPLMIIMSCNFKEKKGEINYPFTDIEITSIRLNPEKGNIETSDSSAINEISIFLRTISSKDLIKSKRLHGAERICEVLIDNKNDGNISILISSHSNDGIMADFLQENKADNFVYSLGNLNNAEELVQRLEKHGLVCDK